MSRLHFDHIEGLEVVDYTPHFIPDSKVDIDTFDFLIPLMLTVGTSAACVASVMTDSPLIGCSIFIGTVILLIFLISKIPFEKPEKFKVRITDKVSAEDIAFISQRYDIVRDCADDDDILVLTEKMPY